MTTPGAAAAQIEHHLRQTIAEQSDGKFAPDGIDGAAPLIEDGYLDSLSSVRLLALIEDTYGVHIEEVDLLGGLYNLQALAAHVAAHAAPTPE